MAEGLWEFLENSTIHGLNYIATAKSSTARLFWLIVVFCGFFFAAVMIRTSFTGWRSSPVSTTIETKSIDQVEINTVATYQCVYHA